MQYIKKHLLYFTVLPLFILFLASSYYRFMVQLDYMVTYESPCDPYTQECYVYCEDDICSEPFYYALIEREAKEILNKCGPDVSGCEAAEACGSEVNNCTVTFCGSDSTQEQCDELTINDRPESNVNDL